MMQSSKLAMSAHASRWRRVRQLSIADILQFLSSIKRLFSPRAWKHLQNIHDEVFSLMVNMVHKLFLPKAHVQLICSHIYSLRRIQSLLSVPYEISGLFLLLIHISTSFNADLTTVGKSVILKVICIFYLYADALFSFHDTYFHFNVSMVLMQFRSFDLSIYKSLFT